MGRGIFELVSEDDLTRASKRVFGLRLDYFFSRDVAFDETLSDLSHSLSSLGYLAELRDSPALRTWFWSVKSIGSALRNPSKDPPISAISHLLLDHGSKDRLIQLLGFQLIGIVAGQSAAANRSFRFTTNWALPVEVYLDGIGLVEFEDQPEDTTTEIQVNAGVVLINTKAKNWQFRVDSRMSAKGLSFQPALQIAGIPNAQVELGYLNKSLFQAAFQPFPQLFGRKANEAWLSEIKSCMRQLLGSGLPNIAFIISHIRVAVGLVSLNDSVGSASREEALGLVYLPVGGSPLDLAECILHESLHQLLFRIEETTPMFHSSSDKTERYYSPWRSDPRPLRMVFHGAFVFTGVAALHLALAKRPSSDTIAGCLHTVYRRWLESATALETVEKYAGLTSTGKKVVEGIRYQLAAIRAEVSLSDDDEEEIKDSVIAHRNAHATYVN